MTNIEKATLRVEAAINTGRILCSYNVLDREPTSVGPYTEAVDRGHRFAVIGWRGNRRQIECRSAHEAASHFVARVGSTRANEASRG